jgi:hypothetical protein
MNNKLKQIIAHLGKFGYIPVNKATFLRFSVKEEGASDLDCKKQLSHRWDDKSHVYGLAASEFTVTINLEGLMSV